MTNEVAKEIIARLKARYGDLVEEYEIWDSYTQGFCEAFELVEGILNNISNADVQEVKRGKWISTVDIDGEVAYENCSVCGMQFRVETVADCGIYCSHCGAKMDGEQK